MSDKFTFTFQGCQEAKDYLKSIGAFEAFVSNNTDVDGFSLVHHANDVYNRLQMPANTVYNLVSNEDLGISE